MIELLLSISLLDIIIDYTYYQLLINSVGLISYPSLNPLPIPKVDSLPASPKASSKGIPTLLALS
ncbi:hypothetical protein [Intestinibacter sp.]|uniref:hypothetical protein n=1 Tax=Intestinibacter sp. TaxID=1965304 RepID=UPI003F17D11F